MKLFNEDGFIEYMKILNFFTENGIQLTETQEIDLYNLLTEGKNNKANSFDREYERCL